MRDYSRADISMANQTQPTLTKVALRAPKHLSVERRSDNRTVQTTQSLTNTDGQGSGQD